MKTLRYSAWKTLFQKTKNGEMPVCRSVLDLDFTLYNGQSFLWKRDENVKEIHEGTIGDYAIRLKHDDKGHVLFQYCSPVPAPKLPVVSVLEDYFQLRMDLHRLVSLWSSRDPYFKSLSIRMEGLRVLRQPPIECFFGFLCSQNNHVSRISKMVQSLRSQYGSQFTVEIPKEESERAPSNFKGTNDSKVQEESKEQCETREIRLFPSLSQLRRATEKELKDLGFGYRASYIVRSAEMLEKKGGEDFLMKLREERDVAKQKALLEFIGVGKKVADCIALFSLDGFNVVPVDTHVWSIYLQKYAKGKKKNEKLNESSYSEVTKFFTELFQEKAGIAHSFLFTAELKEFSQKNKENRKTRTPGNSETETETKSKRVKKNKEN